MVCVVCSCCATFPYREVCRAKGGIRGGETLCHDIYPARPITTVSLATNTHCIMDGHSSCSWAPGSNLAVRVNRAIDDQPGIQQEAICYEWFKQQLILSVSKPSISQILLVVRFLTVCTACIRQFHSPSQCVNCGPSSLLHN